MQTDSDQDQVQPVIRVEGVSKTFHVPTVRSSGVGSSFAFSDRTEKREALRNVSLTVGRSRTMGIIGHNGAGKSTLLKIITGIMRPDSGSVHIDGDVTPIIGLGAGFSPKLSGLENIYLKGAAMGMSEQEVEARMDEIRDFSGVGYALNRPLRTWSSGMRMRLAFSIAFLKIPDVLIVDETLAVGDEVFRRKSMARIEEIKDAGATILLVSHGGPMLKKFCDNIMLLDHGEALMDGDPGEVLDAYQRLSYAAPEDRDTVREEIRAGKTAVRLQPRQMKRQAPQAPPQVDSELRPVERARSRGAHVMGCHFLDSEGEVTREVAPYDRVRFECLVKITQPTRDVYARVALLNSEGLECGSFTVPAADGGGGFVEAGVHVGLGAYLTVPLVPGAYFVAVDVFGHMGPDHYCLHGLGDLKLLRVVSTEDCGEGPACFNVEPILEA